MVLVDKCYDFPDNVNIRTEYWRPEHRWKEVEFLTSSFVVLREIPFEQNVIMMTDYIDDFILARRVFG